MMPSDPSDDPGLPPEEPPTAGAVPPIISTEPAQSRQPAAVRSAGSPGSLHHIIFAGRLHPMTLVFNLWGLIRGFIVPAIILLFVGNAGYMGGFLLLVMFVPLVVSTVRYFTFTYRIEGGELITAHGLLGRTERNIPLARVQDIRVEQGVLHRIFGMAEVNIETAGGHGAEASLSVLSKKDAESLRTAIFEQANLARQATGLPATDNQTAQAPEVIRELSLRELIVAGLTSNQTASVLAFLAVGFNLLDDVMGQRAYERLLGRVGKLVEYFFNEGIEHTWVQLLVGATAILILGMLFSVVGSVVVFYGFKLSRRGEDLHRSYGLLTRRASSLPRRRIQVLKIEEKPLRRAFHLATVRADTAGSRPQRSEEDTSGRDMLLPVIPREEIESLLPVFFPDLDTGEADWRKVSRRAIYRNTLKGGLVCLIAAGALWGYQGQWRGLWPLAAIPLVLLLNIMSYRRLGYWLGEKFFRTRRGWLSRATHVVPIRNMQSIVIRRTLFDRRHKVSSLVVDTAGQAYTGGGPRIDNVPWEEALATARTLARRAAETRYRW